MFKIKKPRPEMVITMYDVEIYRGNVVPVTVEIDGRNLVIKEDFDLFAAGLFPQIDPKEL